MRRLLVGTFVCAVAIVSLALLTSCGGTAEPASQAADPAATTSASAQTDTGPSPGELADAQTCLDEISPIVTAEQEVNGRLSVGVSYDEYRRLLGRVGVTYDRINVDALSPECLDEAGVPVEKAFNAHSKAENAWNNCLADYNCDVDSIDPQLQRNWAQAGRLADGAADYLNQMEDVVS